MAERRTARAQRDRRVAAEERPPYDEDVPEAQADDPDTADDDRDPPPPRRRERAGGAAGRMSAADAAEAALRSLASLTGKKPEGITAVEPAENGWLVGVEVIEDQRIPSSADILATYEAELADDGTLMSYRRTRRYARGRGDSGEGS